MRIAIIGGGLSGFSLYLWFEKLGLTKDHEIKIYEARQAAVATNGENSKETYNASVIGASIGLSPNGPKVLKRLDENLYEEIVKTGHEIRTCKITNARGWMLADVPAGPDNQTMLMISREDLWQCFRRKVPECVIVRKKVKKVEIGDAGNALIFSDGSQVEADLVVGADGIWSVVKRAIFDAGEGKSQYQYSPHYEGLVGVGGFVPSSKLIDVPNGEFDVVFGGNGFFGYAYTDASPSSPLEHGDRAVWWSTYSLDQCPEDWRNIDKQNANQQLKSRHSTWKNKTVQNIIQDVEVTSVYPMFTTPLLPTWERSGCVLVGDAAHALQPSSGQGGSMALEDCEALALFLQYYLARDEKAGHITATKQYFELRQHRVAMVHKKAQETGALKQDMGIMQEMMMYFFIWLINRFHLGDTYNRSLYSYDGSSEVQKKIEESAKQG